MPKYITDNLKISSGWESSDKESSDEENHGEKNSNEDNYSEKNLMKNKLIIMIMSFLREQFSECLFWGSKFENIFF